MVNIKSDGVAAQDDEHGFTTENTGVYVPDKQDQAAKTFDFDHYNNELWFNVGSDGALRVGVKKTTGETGDWTVLDNFQLTYYGNDINYVTLDDYGYATFASTSPLDLQQENLPSGVKAYKASRTDATIAFTALNQTVPANTGVLVVGGANEVVSIPVVASGDEVDGNEFIVGMGKTFAGASGFDYFAMKKNQSDLTFAMFNPSSVVIATNKAYLKVPDSVFPGEARLVISFEEDGPTGINAIEAADAKAEGLKDGKYFIGNKIILVKNGVKYSANGQILK